MIDITLIAYGVYAAGAVKLEVLKSKQLELDKQTKEKIKQEGIYHITTKENAEKMMESGFIAPTGAGYSEAVTAAGNHFARTKDGKEFAKLVYMFAGKPTKNEISKDALWKVASHDGTYYAIKHTPDPYEIENYTQRYLDGAITYEGRLDIANSKPELVRLKMEKNKLVEIPWDAQVKANPVKKIMDKALSFPKSSLTTAIEIPKALFFRDKTGKLKACKERRKIENKFLEQYNDEKQQKDYIVEKNEKNYQIRTVNTRKIDGKNLTEMEVVLKKEGNLRKSLFMDAMDVTQIGDNHLQDFLIQNMNENSLQDDYIGKPIMIDGEVRTQKDEQFAEHFYAKQKLKEENDKKYSEFLKQMSNPKSEKQLDFFKNIFEKTSARQRKEAFTFIQNIKNKTAEKLKPKQNEMFLE